MANVENPVLGLNGHEIIGDLLYHMEKQLERDCNLTRMCSYEGGYEAEVHIKMKLHGIDTETVETIIPLGVKDDRAGIQIEAEVKVGRDDRLDVVRTRSEQPLPNPNLEKIPENPMDTQQQPAGRRRYQKASPHPVGNGGATGDQLETE